MFESFSRRSIILLKFFIITTVVACNDNGDHQSSEDIELLPRIVGGQNVKIIKHPYVVSVRRKTNDKDAFEHYCGGTIYNNEFIITAAKCVLNVEPENIHVVAGTSLRTGSIQDGGMIFPVIKIIVHEELNVDLALLQLSIKIPINNSLKTRAVSLAKKTPTAGTQAVIVGWGQTEEVGPYSEQLREATVPIVDELRCVCAYQKYISKDYGICAGLPNGSVDACHGDAGGPLLVNGLMVGVTSWVNGCARSNSPGIYTNVVQLNEWIVNHALGVHISFL